MNAFIMLRGKDTRDPVQHDIFLIEPEETVCQSFL